MKSNFLKAVFVIIGLLSLSWMAGAQSFGPWQAPTNAGSVLNSACNDLHPTLSRDGLTLIFSSTRPFDHVATSTTDCLHAIHLWGSQRASVDSPWTAPVPLSIDLPADSPFEDHGPNISGDGHWLFFHSQRPGDSTNPSCNGGGYRELWASHRQNNSDLQGWETPVNLGCTLNFLGADDAGPNVWEDSATGVIYLYFTRNLTPLDGDGFDIYVTNCTSDISNCIKNQLWAPGIFDANLSSPTRDTRTGIRRRDGLEMLITTNRAGSLGGLDIWVSSRASANDPWSAPLNLNVENLDKGGTTDLNTSFNDAAPALSDDGETMLFYSNRPGGYGGTDLCVTTRQKVHGAN